MVENAIIAPRQMPDLFKEIEDMATTAIHVKHDNLSSLAHMMEKRAGLYGTNINEDENGITADARRLLGGEIEATAATLPEMLSTLGDRLEHDAALVHAFAPLMDPPVKEGPGTYLKLCAETINYTPGQELTLEPQQPGVAPAQKYSLPALGG